MKTFIIGISLGILTAAVSINIAFRRYYVFLKPTEAVVLVDGHSPDIKLEKFAQVNEFLKTEKEEGVFVYPRSGSSYTIVYLPKNNHHVDELEMSKISKIIRDKMNEPL